MLRGKGGGGAKNFTMFIGCCLCFISRLGNFSILISVYDV